jgi:hypothetical protein
VEVTQKSLPGGGLQVVVAPKQFAAAAFRGQKTIVMDVITLLGLLGRKKSGSETVQAGGLGGLEFGQLLVEVAALYSQTPVLKFSMAKFIPAVAA